MADSAIDGPVIGAISTVCTVLLGAAGLNLNQLSNHNSKLVGQLDSRNADVDALNKRLLIQGEELGSLRNCASQIARVIDDNNKLEDEVLRLSLEVERGSLERLSLKAEGSRLVQELEASRRNCEELILELKDYRKD